MSLWSREQINSDVLILMALKAESQGLFEKAGYQVHYTGVGKVNAAAKATEVILQKKPKWIVNLGTAGSHKLKVHEMIECSGFVDRDVDFSIVGHPKGVWPGRPAVFPVQTKITKYNSGICGTGDHLELNIPKVDCDLMDMEALALAQVAEKYKIQFVSIKYITDSSDVNVKSDWKENLKISSESLLKAFESLIL